MISQGRNVGLTEGMRRFASQRPVLFSLGVILVAGLLTGAPLRAVFMPWLGDPAAKFLEGIIGHVLTGLALVGLLVKLGLFGVAGFTPPRQWKALWLVWPLVLLSLVNLWSLVDGSLVLDTSRPGLILLYLCLVLAIGFCEEVMGRGVVLSVMLQKWGGSRRGIYLAVLVSGALFGVAHIFRLIRGELPLLSSLTQMVYSLFFGVVFAACVLRNNSIWPMVVMHAAVDLGGSMLRDIAVGGPVNAAVANSTVAEAVTSVVITLPLFLYGLFILRRVAPSGRFGGVLGSTGHGTSESALDSAA